LLTFMFEFSPRLYLSLNIAGGNEKRRGGDRDSLNIKRPRESDLYFSSKYDVSLHRRFIYDVFTA
jgi:hypothetical protein